MTNIRRATLIVVSIVVLNAAEVIAQKTTFTEQPMRIAVAGVTLQGTLTTPNGKERIPAVLMIAGSGPTDRDGNSNVLAGSNDSLKLPAHGLAANGIASLRYDKRGVGESISPGLSEASLSLETYINDAVTLVGRLKKEKRFSSVTIVGHSEGSLVGMIAAKRSKADAFVSIAGMARAAHQVLLTQIKPKLPPELFRSSEEIISLLLAGRTTDKVPTSLNVLFRPSVQPYLISMFKYDPAKEFAGLKIPTLILQGTTDIQVAVNEAQTLARYNPKARLVIINEVNHVLKKVPDDEAKQLASYSDPTLPIVTQLITEAVAFIKTVKAMR